MKNILCYGDSNTWGNIAGSRNKELMLAERYEYNVRWPGILQQLLGNDYRIIEGGLNGHNTSFDEIRFKRPSRNGLKTLPLILEMNYPLDLVILMLGTNDAIIDFNAEPTQTIQALREMILYIKNCCLGPKFTSPKIILMAPTPIIKINSADFDLFYDDKSITKTQQLIPLCKKLAEEENCAFLDTSLLATVDLRDGVHITQESHPKLAKAIAEKIINLF